MNLGEVAFVRWATDHGWTVTKQGWPDFICRRGAEVMAVEVKDGKDFVRPEQWAAIFDLRRAGMPTFVWTPAGGLEGTAEAIGESLASLQAENARLRSLIADMLKLQETVETAPVVGVLGYADDDEVMRALALECSRTHPEHKRPREKFGQCAWFLMMSQRGLTDDEMGELSGLSAHRVRQRVGRAERWCRQYRHKRIHRAQEQQPDALCEMCLMASDLDVA